MNDVWQRLRAIALTDVGKAISDRFKADRALGRGTPDPAVASAMGAYLSAPLPVMAPAPAPPGYATPPPAAWLVPPVTVPVRAPDPVPAFAAAVAAPAASVPVAAAVPPVPRPRRHAGDPDGRTTVSLVFADGAEVELAPDDPRVRPFRTAVSLLVDG
jgi:hypothetical protein